MRVSVVGATGNLGRHLCQELVAMGHQVDPIGRAECDLAEPHREQLYGLRDRLTAFDTHLCFNAAAYTDVDGAERETDRAFLVNALGAELVARAAEDAGATVCHISTDFVFGGDAQRPYDEFDLPNPQSVYARSKRAGEELVLRATRRCFVVRVGGLYGQGGRNFFSTLVQRMRAGQELKLDCERQVSPTWTRALAQQLVVLCERGEHGIYHATCQGQTTWHGFATALCEEAAALGFPLPIRYTAVASSELPTAAARPAMSLLEPHMLRLRGLLRIPTWRDALRGYLHELIAAGQL
jgi:dTDP-4-dehydrorhamnose reductase